MTVTPEMHTVAEVAESLRIGRKEVYDAINAGELPCRRRGRKILVEVEDMREWYRSWPRELEPRS